MRICATHPLAVPAVSPRPYLGKTDDLCRLTVEATKAELKAIAADLIDSGSWFAYQPRIDYLYDLFVKTQDLNLTRQRWQQLTCLAVIDDD